MALQDHRRRHPGPWRRRGDLRLRPGQIYASQRTLRLADGPDEVHNRTIARMEFAKYGDLHAKIRAERDAERVPVGMR